VKPHSCHSTRAAHDATRARQILQPDSGATEQKQHTPFGPPGTGPLVVGRRVRARGATWRIRHIQSFDSCTIVHLAGIGRNNAGEHRVLLDPFDRLQPETNTIILKVVRKRRWYRALKALLAVDHPCNGLRTAALARIELIPFQLEPALAAIRGLAGRFLLADEVGLGKTIQAGLLLNELRDRGRANHVLILTPSGLRRQWQTELSARFSIDATVIDSTVLRQRASSLPAGTNPWLIDDVAIASIDFIKRPEAMRGLGTMLWDLLLIDEAHVAAQATRRHAAVQTLARRARRVVLATATPHPGDTAAFASLCDIGGCDNAPLAMFRRRRSEVGLAANRRVKTLPVTLAPTELRIHELLRAYASLVLREAADRGRGALLAMAVLIKRALSSPSSLQISIDRRLKLLSEEPLGDLQLTLPLIGDSIDDDSINDDSKTEEFDDRDIEPLRILTIPGLVDRPRELTWLREIGAAARTIAVGRKLQVLRRLLARIHEPAVVFTEYRDTLQHVAAALTPIASLAIIHGGLTEADRIQAQVAFTSGAARVLLATDAAGEGLNLQARCRLVINLELPWNPMRLEQRIGRVDRLGQARPVHVINLFARHTAEGDVLARLVRRLDRARQQVGHMNDPLGDLEDSDLTSAIFGGGADTTSDDSAGIKNSAGRGSVEAVPPLLWQPDLRHDAIVELQRLQSVKRLVSQKTAVEEGVTLVTTVPIARLPGAVRIASVVWIIRSHLVDADGQLIEQALVALAGPAPFCRGTQKPAQLRTMLRTLFETARSSLFDRVSEIASSRLRDIADSYTSALGGARARELTLVRMLESDDVAGSLFQAGLFDRRAARDRDEALRQQALGLGDAIRRLNQIDVARRGADITEPELALVLLLSDRRSGQ
jgi:superfamily II DNA or RNA helicase